MGIWGNRRGSEPTNAKSPLKLRRAIAVLGLLVTVVALAVLVAIGELAWWSLAVLGALALVSVVDLLVINARLRQRRRRD